MRLGIDVGGTFTDLVLIDDRTGAIYSTKVLTVPRNPADGVLAGIDKILALAGASIADVDYLVHGTTIGTNALIERKGAKTGLITTAGFRDVLEIARIERPDAGLYDVFVDLPDPLVPRYLRREVRERIGADGTIVVPLDEATAVEAAQWLKDQGVEAIAICLLFAFRNPVHERRVRDIVHEIFPAAYVSLSSEVAPEFREYERTSTTVINAYLQPVTARYVTNLVNRLHEQYGEIDLRIMQASGGSMTADVAKRHAVNMVNSGPAGGALATAAIGRLTGDLKLIGVDMGGTSFDIGLVVDGQPRIKSEGEFEGYPVKIPLVDVEGIGAGGGSIAWVDAGGALNVGPQSAGADPGPACYGLGGTRPTVTDANLVLGRLNPDYFLGGEMKLYPDRARQAIAEHVAELVRMSVEEAASGIIRVVNANMVRGISVNSIQKGYDVREFALLAFGGAGPLHTVELARELGIRRVVVPPYASTLSAFGLLVADTRHDYVMTVARHQRDLSPADLLVGFQELESRGWAQLQAQRVPNERVQIYWSADVRYEGQSYELNVPVDRNGPRPTLTGADITTTIARFHDLHRRIYAYGSQDEPVEFINLRVAAVGKVPEVRLARLDRGDSSSTAVPTEAKKGERPVYFFASGFVPTAIYERHLLVPGNVVVGPCLVEEPVSTTVIPPGAEATVDDYGNLLVTIE